MKVLVGLVLIFIAVATSGVRAQEETTFDHDAFTEILARYDANNDSLIDEEEFHEWFEEVLPELAEHEHEHEHEHEEGEEDEEAERGSASKRVITTHNFTAEPCPLDEELFEIYDQDASGSLNRTEAQEMSQQLMLMLLSGCNEHTDEASQSTKKCSQGETYEYWLAGLASTSLVCLLSLVGLVLLPCMGRSQSGWQALVTMALLAFAAGALFGDAIFHILPSIFGAHSHDQGSDDHGHNHGEEEKKEDEHDKRYLGLAAMVFIGALLFFGVEKLLLFIVGEAHSHGGSHTHGEEGAEMDDLNDEESTTSDNDKFRFKQLVDKLHDKVQGSVETIKDAGDGSFVKGSAIQAGREMTAAVRRLRFAKSYGWLNLVADAFHNFIDGIAIGASYSQSLSLGISTTIAVICHEIPQELGDYALIVKAGFGRIFALLFNFFSASLAFLGCLIGLGVGEVAKDGDDWILAFTAGGFLYIALSNMVPELHGYVRKLHWMGVIYILIQLAGFILGAGILLLIAAFEEDIDFC